MKKLICILLSVVLCFSLCACDFARDIVDSTLNEDAKAKSFDLEGVSIELTTDFLRMDFLDEEYDFIVGDDTLTILGLKMPYEEAELADLTVMDFAKGFRELMEDNNPTEITEVDGIPTMQYRASGEDGEQTIAVMYYKATDCFWIICFTTMTEDFEDMYDDICKYAKTVKCE